MFQFTNTGLRLGCPVGVTFLGVFSLLLAMENDLFGMNFPRRIRHGWKTRRCTPTPHCGWMCAETFSASPKMSTRHHYPLRRSDILLSKNLWRFRSDGVRGKHKSWRLTKEEKKNVGLQVSWDPKEIYRSQGKLEIIQPCRHCHLTLSRFSSWLQGSLEALAPCQLTILKDGFWGRR